VSVNLPAIDICICTYKRPQLLAKLLDKLQVQKTEGLFTYSIIIVDNDREQTAKKVVSDVQKTSTIDMYYYCEPRQNIAHARNLAVNNSHGNLIAFLDDDEFPIDVWLLNLLKTYKKYMADGVLGPVNPHFEREPPLWIVKGKICERKSFATGTVLKNYSETRTGNVLFDGNIFKDGDNLFNPVFGKTGGEDVDFFRRMMAQGCIFVWCNEAIAYETVPEERLTKKYHLKRALLRGGVSLKHPPLTTKVYITLKSIAAITVYSLALPFLYLIGEHLFMRYLIKYFDHVGRLSTAVGLRIITEKD